LLIVCLHFTSTSKQELEVEFPIQLIIGVYAGGGLTGWPKT